MPEIKVGDLVVIKSQLPIPGKPCVVYSIHSAACKVYDPLAGSIRTTLIQRLELINECSG